MQDDFDQPVRGAAVDAAALIGNRFAGRLLNVAAPSRALANLAGQRRTRQRGRGLEFEEVRQYVPGDDVRAIDWRVTARSGHAHTKLFHEDHEQPITVAIDLRNGMKFGSRNAFKSVLAAHTASLLLWSGLDHGERVGALVLHEGGITEVRAKRSRNTVLQALGTFAEYGAPVPSTAQETLDGGLAGLLRHLQRCARPGGRIFLVSDFADAAEPEAFQALRQLAKKAQIIALHVSDPLERQLPRGGRYTVTDNSGAATLETSSASTRTAYARDFVAQMEQLTASLRDYRVPLVQLSTAQSPLRELQRLLPKR